MKKIIVLFILIIAANKFYAQNESDALGLSQYFTGGTARGISLSGAFGALGGDVSALSINPAGIGVYRSSEFVFTPSFTTTSAKSTYFGTKYTDTNSKLGLANAGLVFNWNSKRDLGWVSASFGFGYNKLIDFNKNVTITGINNNSTFLDEFALKANQVVDYINTRYTDKFDPDADFDELDYYYGQLGAESNAIFFVDTVGSNGLYLTDCYYDGYNQDQTRIINTKGNVGEYAFTFGANYSNKLFLGATFGVQSVRFGKTESHDEYSNSSQVLNSFLYNEEFSYTGTGINFKVGAIYKPINFLRLGLAFHTPTLYNLQSEYTNSMQTWFNEPYASEGRDEFSDYLDYNFTITSPMKAILSGALQSKLGFLSFDYEYVDYSATKIKGEDDPFTDVNQTMQNIFRSTHNLKFGGELKIENFALRGGYGFYGSPFQDTEFNKDAKTQSYSFGFGYRGESMFIDFGYITYLTSYKYSLYSYNLDPVDVNSDILHEISDIEQKTNKFVLTVGFRF